MPYPPISIRLLNPSKVSFNGCQTVSGPAMFNFLGTPPKDKKIIIYETGHLVPRTDLIRESLGWFDHYLGPVKK